MKLSLRAKKILNSLPVEALLPSWGELSGHETSSVLGDEADFNEYKAYALGDEVRRIDWKVYARRERFFVKRFSSERARSTLVIIDNSASMKEAFLSNDAGKHSHHLSSSSNLAENSSETNLKGLTRVLMHLFQYLYLKQEPYAVSVIRKGKMDFYKVQEGSKQLQLMYKMLTSLQPEGTNFYLQEMMDSLQTANDIKNILFFSDFQMEPRALIPLIQAASRKQLSLTCIAYFNPKLLDIQFLSGLRWIKDRETGNFAMINQRDMKSYKKIVLNHYEEIERFLLARHVFYHQLDFRDKDELANFISLFNH